MNIASEQGRIIFRKTERELMRLASGPRAEAVHSFRTTTRRLQTLLEQVVAARNRNEKKLLKMLNRIRKSAGKVRDIDVQLAALRSLKVAQEPRRKTQLTQGLLELRAEYERRLGKLLKKSNVRELRKRLKRAAKELRLSNCQDPVARAKQMLESVKLTSGPADEEVLHRYRIVVKQARYVAEFAPASVEARKLIGKLKRLQDALGHWHDWLTLTQTAIERLGDMNESSLVAALHNVTRLKFRQAVAAVAATSVSAPPATGAGRAAFPEARRPRKAPTKNPAATKAGAAA